MATKYVPRRRQKSSSCCGEGGWGDPMTTGRQDNCEQEVNGQGGRLVPRELREGFREWRERMSGAPWSRWR